MVLRKAADESSPDVLAKPNAKALAEFSDAVVKILPLLGLQSDSKLQKSLDQLKQEGTATNEATAKDVFKQTLARLQGLLPSIDSKAASQSTSSHAAQASAPSSEAGTTART
jgi:hypothetical protein